MKGMAAGKNIKLCILKKYQIRCLNIMDIEKFTDKFNLKYFKKGGFKYNVLIMSSGTIIGQALILLSSPILARIFVPSDFGIFAIYTSIISIFTALASLRYEMAIPLPKEDKDAINILALSCFIVILIVSLVMLLILFFSKPALNFFKITSLRQYLWFLPFGIALIGVNQVFNYWSVRKKNFECIIYSKLSCNITQILVLISAGLLKLGTLSFFLSDILSQIVANSILFFLSWVKNSGLLRDIELKKIRSVAFRYRKFPLISSYSDLVNILGLQLPFLVIAFFYGPLVAGWFAFAQKIMRVPIGIMGEAISQVFLSEISQLQDNLKALSEIYFKLIKKLFIIGLVFSVSLLLLAPLLFRLLFGSIWSTSGVYAQYLAIVILLEFVISPLSQVLNVLRKQHWQLAWNIGRLIIVITSLLIPYELHWAPSKVILSYSLSLSFVYISLFFLHVIALKKGEVNAGRKAVL